MLGQFVIPAAPRGLSAKALLRNTERGGEDFDRRPGISVDLRVFRGGLLQYRDENFTNIPLNGLVEISSDTCPAIAGDQSNLLIVARCSLPGADGYFGQEHQLIYENRKTGAVSSLLYDQLPVPPQSASMSPIVVIAPKVWIGRSINSFVAFPSTNSRIDPGTQRRPLDVKVLDERGRVVVTKQVSLQENSTLLFDVKESLSGNIEIDDTPKLFTVVAKGGAAMFAVVTFTINEATGNFALEHSLPPMYYASGNMQRIRSESLEFGTARSN